MVCQVLKSEEGESWRSWRKFLAGLFSKKRESAVFPGCQKRSVFRIAVRTNGSHRRGRRKVQHQRLADARIVADKGISGQLSGTNAPLDLIVIWVQIASPPATGMPRMYPNIRTGCLDKVTIKQKAICIISENACPFPEFEWRIEDFQDVS